MKKIIILISIIFVILFFNSCNSVENITQSSTILVIESLSGKDLNGDSSSDLWSDVDTNGTVYNDNVEATISAKLINPLAEETTYYQDAIIDQIDVSFRRPDGKDVEGVDVPYSFSQKLNVRVEVNGSSTFSFVVIRQVAKLEAPLRDLKEGGNEGVLELIADITFYAKDVAGNRITPVTASITVWCANFADSEE